MRDKRPSERRSITNCCPCCIRGPNGFRVLRVFRGSSPSAKQFPSSSQAVPKQFPSSSQAIPKRFPNHPNPLFNRFRLKRMAIFRGESRSPRRYLLQRKDRKDADRRRTFSRVSRRQLVRAEAHLHRACPACHERARPPAVLNMVSHTNLRQRSCHAPPPRKTARRRICAKSTRQNRAVPEPS